MPEQPPDPGPDARRRLPRRRPDRRLVPAAGPAGGLALPAAARGPVLPVLVGMLLLVLPGGASGAGGAADPQPLPPRVLWAWERPEDLGFLEPGRDAVAVLVATVEIPAEGGVRWRGRRHPLVLPEGLARVAVTRVEVAPGAPLDADLAATVAAAIAATAVAATAGAGDGGGKGGPESHGVQVDFDARLSERPFYAALLRHLRRHLGEVPLTITALASWCLGDPWLAGLPIDDAVPMLFRMGIDDDAVRRHLAGGGDFSLPVCRNSLGLSTDEPWPALPGGGQRRLYLFHPRPWTPEALAAPLPPLATGGARSRQGGRGR